MHLGKLFPPVDMEWLGKARRRYASAVVGAKDADRVPVDPMMLGHATVCCGHTIRDFYANPPLAVRCMAFAQELYDLLPVTKYHFAHPWLPELGLELKPMDLTAPVPVNVPVPDAESVEALTAPSLEEIKNGFSYRTLVGTMDYTKEHIPEMFVPLAYCPEPVGSAAQLCGLEQFLMWTATDMDLVKKLISVYIETAVTAAGAIADRFGMAVINTGAVFENSDTMSPGTIAEISPPSLDRLVRGCLKKGAGPQVFYHFCGNHKDDYMLFRDTILFTPLTILQMGYWDRDVFPARVMKETFGDRCTIMPSVDTKLFPLGNIRQIYDQARDQVLGGRDSRNGFILGTACEVPPLSFPAGIHAMVRAAKDFGSYGTW